MRRAIVVSLGLIVLCSIPAIAVAADLLASTEVTRLLKQGGVTLLLRHGQTEPGIGDPPGFKLGDCTTQRNLSPDGRADLRGMASRLTAKGIMFAQTLTSEWCRCRETAAILAGRDRVVAGWSTLNSQFPGNAVLDSANSKVIEKIRTIPAGESWLMVTHQINITGLTGVALTMGEGVLTRPAPGGITVLGRVKL